MLGFIISMLVILIIVFIICIVKYIKINGEDNSKNHKQSNDNDDQYGKTPSTYDKIKYFQNSSNSKIVNQNVNNNVGSRNNNTVLENESNVDEEKREFLKVKARFEKIKQDCIQKQFLFIRAGQDLVYNMDDIVERTFDHKAAFTIAMVGYPNKIQELRTKLYNDNAEKIWQGSFEFRTYEGQSIIWLIETKSFRYECENDYAKYSEYISYAIRQMARGIVLGSDLADYYEEKCREIKNSYGEGYGCHGNYYRDIINLENECLTKLGY